jgi:uncharacterized protein (DUF2236 family)
MAGYFSDDSVLRRVHRERALALSGPRALLMQAAHPLAVSGLLAHSSGLDDPYGRLERTAVVMDTIAFGSRAEADRLSAGVRAMHRRVRGRLREPAGRYPRGTPYRADDPELLMWILFTLVDSALLVYGMYVGPLTRAEQEAYWEDYKVIGRLFGLPPRDMPDTLDELFAYRGEMLDGDELHVTPWARSRAREIVMDPPLPLYLRPLRDTVNFITVALLPPRLRREYGFWSLPPATMRKLMVAGGAEYVRRAVIPLLPDRLRLVPSARAA